MQYVSSSNFILYLFAFSEDWIREGLIWDLPLQSWPSLFFHSHISCCFQPKAHVSYALNIYEINHSYLFKTKAPNLRSSLELLSRALWGPNMFSFSLRSVVQYWNVGLFQKGCGCALELYRAGWYPEVITNSSYIKMLMSVQSRNSPTLFLRTHFSLLSPLSGNCSHGICVL